MNNDYTLIRFRMVGYYQTGKTSILHRYIEDNFLEQSPLPGGVDFMSKRMEI